MRALLPRPVDDVDVHEHYAHGWIDRGGIRVDMISSLDGAATAGGLSAGLQTPGDNRVFAALRDLADVVLVGSGTARAEGYAPVRPEAARRALRTAHGIAATLTTAVLSRDLNLDPQAPLFTGSDPDAPTIVLTCAAAPSAARAVLARHVEVVICGADSVDLTAARAALAERGLTRVLCEGGPTTFAALARAGQVDDLCLSVTPLLVGPGAQRIVAGVPWFGAEGPQARRMRLTGLLEEDGALFLRLSPSSVPG